MKIFIGIVSVLISTVYVVGFFFDAAFLEKFSFKYYELIADPLEYFSIGGMYILFNFTKFLVVIGVIIFSCGLLGLGIKINTFVNYLIKTIGIESVPYIILGIIVFSLFFMKFVIKDAQKSAADFKENNARQEICVTYRESCYRGIVLRYRSAKVIFISKEKESLNFSMVIPEKQITYIRSIWTNDEVTNKDTKK